MTQELRSKHRPILRLLVPASLELSTLVNWEMKSNQMKPAINFQLPAGLMRLVWAWALKRTLKVVLVLVSIC